jgi:hypothetical protein
VTVKPTRRWYQFSLKTLLVVLTLLCLGPGGYVAYEQAKARRQKVAVGVIEELGGSVEYDQTVPARSAMVRQILGDESFGNVNTVSLGWRQVSDADLVHLAEITKLKTLWLGQTDVTDAGLVHLADQKALVSLSLTKTKVTDAGLVHLVSLTGLTELWLDNTQVADAGLVHLSRLTGLKKLYLTNTKVTDAGLIHLVGLTKLEKVSLENTQVSDAGVAELQKALPKCIVFRRPFP